MIAALLMFAIAGGMAEGEAWTDEDGAKRHNRLGVVCPAAGGNIKLTKVEGDAETLNCSYEYKCPEPGAGTCGTPVAFVSVTYDPKKDYAAQMKQLVDQVGLKPGGKGPEWGAKLRYFASGKGPDPAYAAWWEAGRMNVGGFYNDEAAADMQALIAATLAANSQ